jgi:hypothetical protein
MASMVSIWGVSLFFNECLKYTELKNVHVKGSDAGFCDNSVWMYSSRA